MTKKFTEEQYQKIVEIGNQYHDDRIRKTEVLLDYMCEGGGFNRGNTEPLDQAIAIANPLTRELAHDKFVEKEKRYVWRSKIENSAGEEKRLYDTADGISDSFIDKDTPSHNGNRITETEVKKWGYNPEMFDKEEV